MRLLSLRTMNFRVLRNMEVDIEPATVVVGPNDSGKSTLLDAIEWLFHWRHHLDRTREVLEVGSWIGEGSWEATVAVIATFSELGPRRRAVLGPLMLDDTVTFARIIGMQQDRWDEAAPYLVATKTAWSQLAERSTTSPADAKQMRVTDSGELLREYEEASLKIGNDLWMPLGDVVDTQWTEPVPTAEDFPSSRDIVRVHGPDAVSSATDLLRPIVRAQLERSLGRKGETSPGGYESPRHRDGR
jgi:energy-coupling factor transporter ATP-binding protein EcfA2